MTKPAKILQIGNYPPPMCGWAIQLKLVTDELRARGHTCEVLKINEGRQIKSPEYVDVQNGFDYLKKVWRYALRGYLLNVHVNGMSKKGFWLAMIAAVTGRLLLRPASITFHGGPEQDYFSQDEQGLARWAFQALFHLAGAIACDSSPIKDVIARYGIRPGKIVTIATFSSQYLQFSPVALPEAMEAYLAQHERVILSYVSFRSEYRLETLREGMKHYRQRDPQAGFIWLGFPDKEVAAATQYAGTWAEDERRSLLLLGSLEHDQFLTLLSRCFIFLRTPACDGVSASVLESIALGVPVVASENGRRPRGVVTYCDTDAIDMCEKLLAVTARYSEVKTGLVLDKYDDNVGTMADWLLGRQSEKQETEMLALR
jgi:glycosyltransferase involved in cell wall biosynthesis